MVLLDQATFLTRFVELHEQCKEKGSVWFGMKRYMGALAARKKKKPEEFAAAIESEEPRCLVRARCSLKALPKRLSTVVDAKDLVRFQLALENVMSLHMADMKKREKKKKVKGVKKDAPGKKDGEKAEKPTESAPEAAAPVAAASAASKTKPKKKK
eukprot:TRINITY_DN70672_c0_g1_i1.p1 TRINITY_DN70672_c0_g1~~TRINITY_DN70672_c0_g1_i1.p1  ORF type:complete len:156 (+),score=43.97 TRINITY_DN70672_c0_g1_i1:79-546(+)